MEIRKTILFIGNKQDDHRLFEKAINEAGNTCNFLALDNEPYTISRLKKSQPFWYSGIFVDLATPSIWGVSLIREIAKINHLKHVPIIAFTEPCAFGNSSELREVGVTRSIPKPVISGSIVQLLTSLEGIKSTSFTLPTPNHYTEVSNVA
jgi:CheY-like chemotaxis protein